MRFVQFLFFRHALVKENGIIQASKYSWKIEAIKLKKLLLREYD